MTLRFTEEHEWIQVEGNTATVGITEYAAEQLGDVVFVELPEVGRVLIKGSDAAVVESVKAASEVYAPIDGEVTAINGVLEDAPATVNESPRGDGWFYRMTIANTAQLDDLLDEGAYNAFVEGLG